MLILWAESSPCKLHLSIQMQLNIIKIIHIDITPSWKNIISTWWTTIFPHAIGPSSNLCGFISKKLDISSQTITNPNKIMENLVHLSYVDFFLCWFVLKYKSLTVVAMRTAKHHWLFVVGIPFTYLQPTPLITTEHLHIQTKLHAGPSITTQEPLPWI